MIGSKTHNSFYQRLLRLFGIGAPALDDLVLSEYRFQVQVQKERLRMLRRGIGFCVVVLKSDSKLSGEKVRGFVQRIIERIRQTDEVGIYQSQLAILLPDTDIDGGRLVSNHLLAEAQSMGFELDSEVLYPDDFPTSGTDGFRPNSNFDPNFEFQPNMEFQSNLDSDGESDQANSERTSTEDVSSAGSFQSVLNDENFSGKDQPTGSLSGSLENSKYTYHGPAANHSATAIAAPLAVKKLRKRQRPLLASEDQLRNVQASPLDGPPSLQTPIWKRGLDVLGASVGLTILSPLLIAVAIAIRLESKGGSFFTQLREGKDGKRFKILKFRTMVVDAEDQKRRCEVKANKMGQRLNSPMTHESHESEKFFAKLVSTNFPNFGTYWLAI